MLKMFILMIAFQPGHFVPEGWPNGGKYYQTAEQCQKAGERQAKKPNVAEFKCVATEVPL